MCSHRRVWGRSIAVTTICFKPISISRTVVSRTEAAHNGKGGSNGDRLKMEIFSGRDVCVCVLYNIRIFSGFNFYLFLLLAFISVFFWKRIMRYDSWRRAVEKCPCCYLYQWWWCVYELVLDYIRKKLRYMLEIGWLVSGIFIECVLYVPLFIL